MSDEDYDESSDEEVNEERRKIKEQGLENLSKGGFSALYSDENKSKRKKKDDRPKFRGF